MGLKKEKRKNHILLKKQNHSFILKMIYLIEIQYIITDYIKQVFIMTYSQNTNIIGLTMFDKGFPNLHLGNSIQHGTYFICNDKFCFWIKSPQYAETLQFPTGKFTWPTSQPIVLKTKGVL